MSTPQDPPGAGRERYIGGLSSIPSSMNARGPDSAVDRVPAIQHACDLDLLLFFKRHPRALLTSDQIVSYLGYDRERIARSLEGLITAGHLTRSQQPSRHLASRNGGGARLEAREPFIKRVA